MHDESDSAGMKRADIIGKRDDLLMKLIQPTCRQHLTAEDMAFITSVLGDGRRADSFLEGLLIDPDTRDVILDSEMLVKAIMCNPKCLRISAYLFFYLITRHELSLMGLDDRETADYVAELLAEFSREERLLRPLDDSDFASEYLVDMLEKISRSEEANRFALRAHIGNYTLFMTGLYPERIRHREERHGAPGVDYYEQVGRMNFDIASHLRSAKDLELTSVLERLAASFHTIRVALNDVAERVIFTQPLLL